MPTSRSEIFLTPLTFPQTMVEEEGTRNEYVDIENPKHSVGGYADKIRKLVEKHDGAVATKKLKIDLELKEPGRQKWAFSGKKTHPKGSIRSHIQRQVVYDPVREQHVMRLMDNSRLFLEANA
eukprot:Platyproteum_vivax@DN15987_c0_g1_i1.p2